MLLRHRSDGYLDYESAVDPLAVRPLAASLMASLPGKGFWTIPQALQLFECVRALAYVPDPIGIPGYVQEPAGTLALGGGNCEAKSLLLCSMFRAVGIPSRMLVIGNGSAAHMLTELCIEAYDLSTLPRDLTINRAPSWLQQRYAGVARSQHTERDAGGNAWLVADPCFSMYAGDIERLVAGGYMVRSGDGAHWTNPPTYFSDGSDRPIDLKSAAGEAQR